MAGSLCPTFSPELQKNRLTEAPSIRDSRNKWSGLHVQARDRFRTWGFRSNCPGLGLRAQVGVSLSESTTRAAGNSLLAAQAQTRQKQSFPAEPNAVASLKRPSKRKVLNPKPRNPQSRQPRTSPSSSPWPVQKPPTIACSTGDPGRLPEGALTWLGFFRV